MHARLAAEDIQVAAEGDSRAAQRVMAQARGVARSVLRRFFWSPEDIEDCTQEVLLRVTRHLTELRDPARFDGWVATIARRVALARQRDQRTLPLSLAVGIDAAGPGPAASDMPLDAELARAQSRLSEPRRQLLELRYRHDLSYAEIAERLDTTVPRVRRRLHVARNQLRREVLRHMADEHGESIRLNRDDLHRLCAAASLVNPEAESSLAAVHLDGGIVFGGTTHRAAVGRTNAEASEVTLALEAEPLLQLADHDTVREAYLGWDETTARLALDDGSVVVTARVTCEPIGSRGPEALLEKLPHRVEASYAEMRELSEHLASVAWGRDGDGTSAVAALIILPGGQIAAQVFHMSMVSYMMSGMLGCVNEEGAERHMLLNRGYLRECLAALPRESERVVIEFGGPLHALCFATPYCPDLAVLMMPMHPTVLTPHERRTWTDLLARQSDATPPEAETEA